MSKSVLEVFGFFADLGKVKGYLLPDMTHKKTLGSILTEVALRSSLIALPLKAWEEVDIIKLFSGITH